MQSVRKTFKQTFRSYSDRCAVAVFVLAAVVFFVYQVAVFSINLAHASSNPVVQFRISPQATFNPALRLCWDAEALFAVGLIHIDSLQADWYIDDFNVSLPTFWRDLSAVSVAASESGGAQVDKFSNFTLYSERAYVSPSFPGRRCADFNADGRMVLAPGGIKMSYDLLMYYYVPLEAFLAQQAQGQLVTPPVQLSYTLYHPDSDPLAASVRQLAINNFANYMTFDLTVRIALSGSTVYSYNSIAVPRGSFGLNATVFGATLNVTNPELYVLSASYCEITPSASTVTTLQETRVYDFNQWLSDLGGTISIIGAVFGLVFPALGVEPRHLRFAKRWTERTRTATSVQSEAGETATSPVAPSSSPKAPRQASNSDDADDELEVLPTMENVKSTSAVGTVSAT